MHVLYTCRESHLFKSDEKTWELDSTGQVHWVKKRAPTPLREVKVIKASVKVRGSW